MTQPLAKKPRVSITERSGGFTHLHEEIVRWELFNFEKFFLATKKNLGLLRQQHLNFVVDGLDDFPQTEWKVFFVVDKNPHEYYDYWYGHNNSNAEYADNWLISLKYELVAPPDKGDLEGLYLAMECDLARQDSIVNSFPDAGIFEACGTGDLFPLCKISDRNDVLLVEPNGSLVLNLKFLFYKGNVTSAESEDVAKKRKLKMNVLDLKAFFTQEGADEVTVVANNDEKFVIQKDLLKARSTVLSTMLEDKDKTMTLDFPPEVVGWMLDFVRSGEVKAFAVKKEEAKTKQELNDNEQSDLSGTDANTKNLPTLSQLIRFADMYELQDLKDYFDFKLPSLCLETPDLAPYLNHLAIKFSLNQAKEKIQTFIARHSDLVLKMMKAEAEVEEEDLNAY